MDGNKRRSMKEMENDNDQKHKRVAYLVAGSNRRTATYGCLCAITMDH